VPEVITPDSEAVEETYACPECGEGHEYLSDAEECCAVYCDSCGNRHESSDSLYYNENFGGSLCEDCDSENRFYCGDCGSEHSSDEEAYDCCSNEQEYHGEMPYLAPVDDPYRVEIPEIAGRPARVCSLEQELASGGTMVARLLYDIGIADESHKVDYHYGGSRRGRAHVEEDGSLPDAGGEVVYDRFNLANRLDAEVVSLALTKIRQLRDTPGRPVTTSYSAGIHVHISARAEDGTTMGPRDMAALYELWSYAEDMLYSFSAAGWGRHRQAPDDGYGSSGYCKPLPKVEGVAGATKVWRVMRSDRYFGLNFQRLYSAVSRCSCGAATMGDWEACDCGAFDGATVEWRVFNSSTLPRTIHAWLLFAHAMTAYAAQHELGTLPVNEYGSTSREEKWEVLEHLLSILPLTDGERDVIREAADRSPGL
jgi:hypothetical protein